jgi:ribosomal protein L37AE/L43A
MKLRVGKYFYNTVKYITIYCKNCKSLFVANMYDEIIVCINCKSSDTVPYNNTFVVKNLDKTSFNWEDLKLSSENSLCPQCDQFSLKFKNVGMWD